MANEKVYGYKGMNADMTCRGMKFAVGNKYHVDGDIDVCKNGFHFCKRLINVFNYYPRDGTRFFVIAASGEIKTAYEKSVASDIEILRELNDLEINRNVYGDGHGYGNGYGTVCCNGDGNGYGYGYCNGNGYGDGFVSGNGKGGGYGDGHGYCDGDGIQRILLFL